MTGRLAAVVPAYGKTELTHAVVADAGREADLVDVWVVDNQGDYTATSGERVLQPGENLGWLRGCNLGMRAALADHAYAGVVLLNNDTRLSPGFFAGLHAAVGPRTGLVGPCYDDLWAHQVRGYTGPADGYVPRSREHTVAFLDGTCLLLPAATVAAVGELDETHFGTTGWGADIDYAVRVRQRGLRVVVTERAYLNHIARVTARAVHDGGDAYFQRGDEDMRAGMAAKYGADWLRVTGIYEGRRGRLLRSLGLRR